MAARLANASLRQDTSLFQALKVQFYQYFEKSPIMPSLVRLAWHDAGSYSISDNSHRPNGSIRFPSVLAYPMNKGLALPLTSIETIRETNPSLSYADVIQAGAYAAILYCKGPEFPFLFGRIDAETEAEAPADGLLPTPTLDADSLIAIFQRMGLNEKELVALTGAHTIGKASTENSGFEGAWAPQPFKFDNAFFIELLENKNKKLLKLPSDEALLEKPELKQWVEEFAKDKFVFWEEFGKAFKKMSELGYD